MRGRVGYSDILATVMILAIVLSAGIGIWLFLSSYAGIWRQGEVRKLGDQALILRSNIGAEYAFFPDTMFGSADRGVIMLRNTGREPIVVFRILTIKNGTVVYDTGVYDLARIPVNERSVLTFRCPSGVCSENDRILVQVHYIPEQLYDPNNPALSKPDSETLLFKIATFEASKPHYGLSGGCTLPTENWLMVEVIDPKEDNIYGSTTDYIKIRVLNASDARDSYIFQVHVKDGLGNEATGTASVSGALPQEVYVQLDKSGLQPPLYVWFTSLMPDFTIFPMTWGFPNSFGNYIDYSKMRIDLESGRVDEVILSVGFWEDGDYEITVDIYDCNNVLIARGVLRVSIELGDLALYIDQYSVVLSSPVNIFNIWRVEIRTTDVTPVTTTTITETVTETIIRTTTTTTTTTIPQRTTTTTRTTTSTRTSTTPSTTTTSTRTLTSTTTVVISSATIVVTRTTYVYTTTLTSTSRITITLTSIIYSPTITNTITSTYTTYTTTRTVTRTFTSTYIVTQTVTSTYTTTTTVAAGGGGRSSGEFLVFQLQEWPIHWQLLLYLSISPLVFYPVARRWRSWWMRG
ncbi:MAG: hypothetical protein QXZ00_07040 [Nitrososphaerota archaeon]